MKSSKSIEELKADCDAAANVFQFFTTTLAWVLLALGIIGASL